MRVRITSDGTGDGTRVVAIDVSPSSASRSDVEVDLTSRVKSVRWWIDKHHVPHANVELVGVEIDATGILDA